MTKPVQTSRFLWNSHSNKLEIQGTLSQSYQIRYVALVRVKELRVRGHSDNSIFDFAVLIGDPDGTEDAMSWWKVL